MANSILQPTFSGGELSPALWGRSDLARYANSLKTCRNFIVKRQGGIDNRPGFRYIAAAKFPDRKCRLIEFEFNTEQTYVIELGHLYFRVFRDGFPIMDGLSPLEVVTPYTEDQVFDVNFVQSADVMTLVHPDVAPQEVRRLADDDWEIIPFESEIGPFRDANVLKSRTIVISAVTGSITITASHNIFSAEHVGTDILLEQVDTGDVSAWMNRAEVSLGDLRYVDERVYEAVELAPAPPAPEDDVLTGDNTPVHTEGDQWDGPRTTAQGITDVLGVKWRYLHSGFGVARITGITNGMTVTATVTRRMPSTLIDDGTYKWSLSAWDSVRGYPRAVTYYQQRLVFAGSRAQPQTFWMSETGIFNGFGTSRPLVADDAISYTIASRQINEIRHLVTLQSLLAMTSGAEWTINAGAEGLAADTLSVEPQNYRGVSNVAPLVVGSNVLYIQRRSRAIRDLGYSFEIDGFTGEDLTLLSSHLFEKFRLVDWGFIQTPYSAAFCIRNDGTLLTMTYLKDQQVLAWARHDTDGQFESVATIAEGDEDYAYVVVRRIIDGQVVRYIERMETRLFDEVEDAFFVDSGLTYDGRNTTDTTVTLSGGTTWEYPEEQQLTASAAIFTIDSVGRTYRLKMGDDYALLEVREYTSTTNVTVRSRRLVPESLREVATTEWALMAETITGLDHLEGKDVAILADGNVEPPQTVIDGSISLQFPAAIVHAGLPYVSDMETLAMSAQLRDGTTLRDNQKLVTSVSLQIESSRGIFAGQSPEDMSFEKLEWLNELKQRDDENWGEPTRLETGLVDVKTNSIWDSEASVFVRQSDPLPLSIQGMIIKVTNGGKR